jgi:hypothetical protein
MTAARLLQRPIYGGVFGDGRYALASMPCVSRGLYSTRYMVVQPQDGVVLSIAEDKVEALSMARDRLTAANDGHASTGAPCQVQGELWPGELSLEPQIRIAQTPRNLRALARQVPLLQHGPDSRR